MAEKRVSKKNLKRFAENIKTNANVLKRDYSYNIDETVSKGQVILKCTTAGTTEKTSLNLTGVSVGSTLTDGTVEWEVISITGYGTGSGGGGGGGSSQVLFTSNTWLDTDTNLTLTSAVTPFDFLLIKCEYSLDGTTVEIADTKVAATILNEDISLSLERNSTQYCILEGMLTTATNLSLDALQLNGFTKFRVSKIVGVIGGGAGCTPATSLQIQSLF